MVLIVAVILIIVLYGQWTGEGNSAFNQFFGWMKDIMGPAAGSEPNPSP